MPSVQKILFIALLLGFSTHAYAHDFHPTENQHKRAELINGLSILSTGFFSGGAAILTSAILFGNPTVYIVSGVFFAAGLGTITSAIILASINESENETPKHAMVPKLNERLSHYRAQYQPTAAIGLKFNF